MRTNPNRMLTISRNIGNFRPFFSILCHFLPYRCIFVYFFQLLFFSFLTNIGVTKNLTFWKKGFRSFFCLTFQLKYKLQQEIGERNLIFTCKKSWIELVFHNLASRFKRVTLSVGNFGRYVESSWNVVMLSKFEAMTDHLENEYTALTHRLSYVYRECIDCQRKRRSSLIF